MGDFERFTRGRAVSSYYGLAPKRGDSGEKTGRNGKITKAGDSLCRLMVLEGVCGINNTKSNAKQLKKGQVVSPRVEAEAKKCNARNRKRYDRLVANGKHAFHTDNPHAEQSEVRAGLPGVRESETAATQAFSPETTPSSSAF